MLERFTPEARGVVERAGEEATALGHDFVGTEHLLLALCHDPTGAGEILNGFGVTRDSLLAEYRGVVDACGFPPGPRPDPEALATVGIDLDEVRKTVERVFGEGALERTRAWRGRTRPRFTDRAKRALRLSVREAGRLGDRRLLPIHVLLGLVAVEEGLAARLLARRGVTKERLLAVVVETRRRPA